MIVNLLIEKLTGLLFGDKGYIKKELFHELFDRGLKLVTKKKRYEKHFNFSERKDSSRQEINY